MTRSTMDSVATKRQRKKLAVSLALMGLLIAATFFGYFETDPRPGSPVAVFAGGLALVLCPGSLLFATWVDIEPQTSAFAVVWLVIGLTNFALYGGVGLFLSRFKRRADSF